MRPAHNRSVALTLVLMLMLTLIAACGGTASSPADTNVASTPGAAATADTGAVAPTAAAGASGEATTTAGASGEQGAVCDFPEQQAVTVNVLAYNSSAIDPFTNAMVENCSKNGVTVAHAPIDFSGQYEKTITTLSGDEGTYDIIEIYSGAIPRYASTDKLVALDELFNKYKDQYQLDEINQTMLDGLSYNGKLYALPMQANITTMVYRKDIFDELGLQVPQTYADLVAAAAAIQESGKMEYPLALPFADSTSTMYEQLMRSEGTGYVDPATNEPTFSSPEAERVLQALVDLAPYMDPEVISFNQPKVQQQLFNGQAAIGMMFSGRMADLLNPENTEFAEAFAFAPPPTITAGAKAASTISVDGWIIPTNSKIDPELLFQIIAASVSRDVSTSALPYAYPARDGIVSNENLPYAEAVQTALANGATTPPMETWLGSVQGDTSAHLQSAITGQLSVADALAEAQKAAVAALAGQ